MDNEIVKNKSENEEKLDRNTEKLIFTAAKKVFHSKGMYGARMQEIADEAGINKAMLHYYFRSKEKLFEAIFIEDCSEFFSRIRGFLNKDMPLLEKIEYMVENYIELLSKNTHIPSFIISEIHHNPERMKNFFLKYGISPDPGLTEDIKTAVALGNIRPIDPRQLIVNIVSMCIFPVVASPILQTIFNFSDDDYKIFIEARKKEVSKFIINSIKIN